MIKINRDAPVKAASQVLMQPMPLPLTGRVIVISEAAGELVSVLRDAGYQVEVVSRIAACPDLCNAGIVPVAILLDHTQNMEADTLTQALTGMQAQCRNRVPVIFVAQRKHVAARLAAYRAGVTRFVAQPVVQDSLLQTVADLALPLPEIPYRILLVGCTSAYLADYEQMLRDAGMEVRLTTSPFDLLQSQDEFAPDVLVLGMEMTQCTGPELAFILRDEARYAAVPVIYLSKETELQMQLNAITGSNDDEPDFPASPNHLIAEISIRARSYRRSREQDKTLQAARYELERQQQAINSHAIVSMADVQGNIVYVNDRFCQVSGYSREELLGQNHRLIKSGQHPDAFYAEMWSTVSSGHIWHGEVCNRSKNGRFYWVDTSIVPFLDDNGWPYHYISIRTDISHVKENEERLRRSQHFANIGTWDWDIQSGELIWSERIAPLFGYASDGLAHTYENLLSAVHPEDVQRVSGAIRDCLLLGTSYNIEHRCVWPDGSIHWLQQRGDVVRDAHGTPLHMLGLVQDVTPRKQAELELLESKASLEEAQNLAKLGNWEADLDSGDISWSDEIYRIYGIDKALFKPTIAAFRNAVHPQDRALVYECEKRVVKTGTMDIVHRIIRADGEVRYLHELARGRFDDGGRLHRLRGTVQDVTRLKETELAMLQAKETAELASRAKSEFLASMSHELRTPLNVILGFSQLFGMDTQLAQATRNNAKHIEGAGRHMLSLVNDLIDLARIESDKLELSMVAVSVLAVVNESVEMVQSMAHDKAVQILPVQCDMGEFMVWADHKRLRQALINLLSNAIKYNKAAGTVRLDCAVKDERVRIAVTDTGVGIGAHKQERVFNAFDRLGEESGAVEGTGIGLMITRRIVNAMGGTIGFRSSAGQGSTFWLEFPLANQRDNQHADALPDQPAPRPQAGARQKFSSKASVLYIEDNEMNMRLMQQIFADRKEWLLVGVGNAETGIEMARANPPRIILMDINLPGMDGYQALALLKAYPETAHIPVLALSANAMKGDTELGLAAGFDDYLTKPLDIDRLLAKLEQLLVLH